MQWKEYHHCSAAQSLVVFRMPASIHFKLLLATVCWGATPTFGRVLARYEAPYVVVCGRFLVASLFLIWFAYSAEQFVRVPKRLWWRFGVLGLTGIFLHNGLMYTGLEYTTATTASIILALIAVQVVLLDLVFYRRMPGRLAIAGVLLAFFGTVVVITEGAPQTLFSLGFGIGEILIFFSALAWAVYSVLGREVLEEYSPLLVTTYATLAGVLLLVPALFVEPTLTLEIYSDVDAVMMISFMGFVGSALGFLWYYQAVVVMGAVGAAIFINLVPVFGVLSAAIFLHERMPVAVWAGGLLVFVGVMLVNWPQSRTLETSP